MQNMLIRTQTSRLLQLSLPSSPISLTPKSINLHQLQRSDPMHQSSPQLARMMINNYTIMSTTSSPKTACVPENRLPYMAPAATSSRMVREDQEKSYNEIVREISDFFKKYPAHPYHDDQMDHRINVNDPQTTRQSNLNVGSSSTTTRGHQRPLDGISMKLERFKIRTVQKGEVVEVEEERKG
ncbi:hypothetical protein ACOSP7_029884 [Xanthoceras sorbifolium]